jgi:hypothetical protein
MTGQSRYLDLSEWTFSSEGNYSGRLDRRDLYNVEHPWVMSETGSFGQIEGEAVIPKGWKPPYALHFYASDDYASEPNPQSPHDWWGIESYVGHRFKQVLIDGVVVWEVDAGDHVVCPCFCADITPYVTPAKPFKVALRVIDKVGTDQTLPDDFTRIGTTEGDKKLADRKFYTNVWWGDVALREQDDAKVPVQPRLMPTQKQMAETPGTFPLPPMDTPWEGPIVLPLESNGLPSQGFPVTCGVPLPCGATTDLKAITLKDSKGTPIAAQFKVMNKWPDGSIRWVLADLIAKPGAGPYTLAFEKSPRSAAPRATVMLGSDHVSMFTGPMDLSFDAGSQSLLDQVVTNGLLIYDICGRVVVSGDDGDEVFEASREGGKVLARGPVRAEIQIEGKLVRKKRSIGRFVFRVAAYAGLPLLRTFFRVFNDTDKALKIKDIRLSIPVGLARGTRVRWTDAQGTCDANAKRDFELSQPGPDAWKVVGTANEVRPGEKASGWFEFSKGEHALQVCVRRFWQQYPKAVGLRDGTVEISLCANPGFEQTPGEAKRHEVWLNFGKADDALADCMLDPPRLFSPEYFAAIGALGPCCTRTNGKFADYSEFMRIAYNNLPPDEIGHGIRNFGDRRFRDNENMWCNNYYDHLMECIAEYRMTGGRTWFDRAEDTACHLMDVDQVHYSADPAKIGAVYSYDAIGHTDGGFWDAMLRHGAALGLYYRLTGDPDARQAMIDLADFILRNKRMTKPGGSKRDYAGVMMTCIYAYDETLDKRYLRHCRKIVEAVLDQKPRSRAGTFVDIRRGTFVEIHGDFNYYGNVPWMLAQLAEPMHMYWRITGDPDAARAIVGFAESVICEDMEPDEPGNFSGYSHNPQTSPSPTYNMLIAPMMMYAHDITGDDYFLTCARGAYELFVKTLREKPRTVIMWNVPALLYFLGKCESGKV